MSFSNGNMDNIAVSATFNNFIIRSTNVFSVNNCYVLFVIKILSLLLLHEKYELHTYIYHGIILTFKSSTINFS